MDIGLKVLFYLLIFAVLSIIMLEFYNEPFPYLYYPIKLFTKFKQSLKSHSMFNSKALIKALSFLCLPTISVLLLLYFWFLDWSRFVSFITAQDGWAGFLRVILILAELGLVYHMYCYYEKRMPNERYINALNDSLGNENFKRIGSVKRDANKQINAYNDSTISNYIDLAFGIPLEANYETSVYRVNGVENAILIKRTPL